MPPDEPTAEEQQQQLPQDNGTPFQPAAPGPDPTGTVNDPPAQAATDGTLDDTHPATDTNIQPQQAYDEGVAGASQASEPNSGNAVTDYTPPAAQPGQTVSPTTDGAVPTGNQDNAPGTTDQQAGQDVSPGEQPPA